MSFLTAFMSYRADKAQAKAKRAMQTYRNKMTNVANAINQNAITTNTTLRIQQSARKAVHLRREELGTLGTVAVSAAAAGTRGRSVANTLINAQRNAGLLQGARERDLQTSFIQSKQQRISSALSAVQNQDLTYIPKPSLTSYLFKDALQTTESILSGGGFSGQSVGTSIRQFGIGG